MEKRNKQLINKFLSGKLSKKGKSRFLKKASSDKAFVKEFMKGVELNEVIEEVYEKEEKKKSDSNKRHNRKPLCIFILAVAAVFSLGIVLTGFSHSFNSDSVFDRYYQPLAASNHIQRGNERTTLDNITKGINLYLASDYSSSIRQFNELIAEGQNIAEIQMFLGLSYMGEQNYQQAIDLFEDFDKEFYLFIPEVTWYLSLCYIKTGKIEEAQLLLTTLLAYDGLYHNDSNELLRQLKRIKSSSVN